MTSNNKEFLLKQAQQLLGMLDAKDLETIQINSTNYDDLSEGLSIEITYPSKAEIKVEASGSNVTGGLPKQTNYLRYNHDRLEIVGSDGEILGGWGPDGHIIEKGEV